MKPTLPFNAYHLSQWSLNLETKDIKNFEKLYYKKFLRIPQDSISYTSYTAVMMGVNAYLTSHDNNIDIKEKILKNIRKININQPNKYRSRPYVFYKIEDTGELFVGSINLNIIY